jgi:hypothetical protein
VPRVKPRNYPIPEDWKEFIGELAENDYFIEAWNFAANKGNTDENGKPFPKACYAFADAHWQDFQPGQQYGPPKDESAETIQEEIDRLTKRLGRMEGAPS